jgi:NADPH-dependent glutamate synthase beta subunit-like oxidoreductase
MDVFRLDTSESQPEISPCSHDCPLGLNQREYHYLIKKNQINDAAKALQKRHPMPSITGRVCPHPCETACSRAQVDSAININGIEQYLGDIVLNTALAANRPEGDKVAVIGSGPAGLSAAYTLTQRGYQVTVFEKDAKPGGLLQYSIPAFRLSDEVINQQITYYEQMGIEFRTGITVGQDVTKAELEQQGFKAFITATGAAKPMLLNVAGADANGITTAISFLKSVRTGQATALSGSVAVIGGGSVALDAARTAVRLGAKEVHVVCLERIQPGHKDNMLALAQEIEEAKEEGVIFHTQRSVSAFNHANGTLSSISLLACESVRNADLSFQPIIGTQIVETLPVSHAIMAIGQTADADLVPQDVATNQRGYIKADTTTLQVSDNIFGAGDGVTGPTTVVVALASGKRAAVMVDRFLKGETLAQPESVHEIAKPVPKNNNLYLEARQERGSTDATARIANFEETMKSFTRAQAQREAERCLTCGSRSKIAYVDDCQVCRLCAHYCPADCIEISEGAYMTSVHNFDVVTLGKDLNQ